MKARFMIISAAVIIGLGAYSLVSFILPTKFIPAEFSEARGKGSELARRIVDLSAESLKNLEEISRYDREGDYPQALLLVSKEVLRNKETYDEAVRLSSQLERMARSLSEIKPSKARILATEAVSSEVALVSRLLSYNDNLLQLFKFLEGKFQGTIKNPDGKVQSLVNKINEEAGAINVFNSRFSQSLAEFDKMF